MLKGLRKSWVKDIRRYSLNYLYEPPDGKWGYVVLVSATISMMTFAYVQATFSLTFEKKLLSIGYETTGAALVLNGYIVFFFLSGFIFGPLMDILTYKYGCILGGLLFFFGLLGTSFAYEMWHFLVLFSIIAGSGYGILTLSNVLAVSTYFLKWRTSAVGVMMAGASTGQVLFNQLVSYSMQNLGFRGTVLIMAAMSLHAVVMPLLYHPLCEHGKKKDVILEQEMKPLTNGMKDEKETVKTVEEEAAKTSCCSNFSSLFNLNILKDPIFLNISFGMMTVFTCDVNVFLIITLYMLHTAGLSVQETALCQTVRAASDVMCRILASFILNKYNIPARYCFVASQVCAALLRFGISTVSDYTTLAVLCFTEGIFRGIGLAYFFLCLAEYCPQEKMAATLGLANFLQGIGCMILGPLIGYLRDSTGDYSLCICVMSGLLLLFSAMWVAEFYILRKKIIRKYKTVNREDNLSGNEKVEHSK